MNDDASTTEADQPMSEDTAAEEPEQPIADSAHAAADEGGDDGDGNGMLGPIELPSTSRLLVGLGGAVMALSTLFSWIELGSDSFPNVSGIGTSTFGVGLTVFLVGLALLVRAKSAAATLGMSLGAFAINLIFILIVGADAPLLGFGAWLGLAGCSVAVLGALVFAYEQEEAPTLDVHPVAGALGAVLAVVASFWLDWTRGNYDIAPLSGVDTDLKFGIPVLILGGIALVLLVELLTPWRSDGSSKSSTGIALVLLVDLLTFPRMVIRRQVLLMICQTAGIAIVVIAGSNVLAKMMLSPEIFGSAPIVALVGGIMLTRSIRQASNH